MPIAALLLDDCPEVYNYKQSPNGDNNSWIIKQPDNKVIIVVVYPIMYIFEWGWANGIYRWFMKKGLKKAGYTKDLVPLNRIDLIKLLINE